VRSVVKRARKRADVVVAAFHWGIERATHESAQQRALAQVALRAGATAVIGSHPHVLQPIRRPARRRLVAYSLGNFVFSAASPNTERTGILRVSLTRRGVVGSRFTRATIRASRPVLGGS
jgi:poly-gamma-glutamate capsule biosynthesis protein CapA/YwtB (metallophosphatase superfamily)